MQHKPKQQPFLLQLADLFLMELTNWRWAWRPMLITAMITPLLGMVAMGVFARDAGSEALAYVLTGNIVLSLMFGILNNVESHFGYLRYTGALDYFATLPIQRHCLILAMVLAFLLLSLPTLVVTIAVGSLWLGVPINPHPLILLVIPACAVPLAGIGAFIATIGRTPEHGGSISLLITALLVSIGPVVVPPQRLPPIMLTIGHFSPATYAASALRQALLGPVTRQIAPDLLVLITLGIVILWTVGHKMDWRQK